MLIVLYTLFLPTAFGYGQQVLSVSQSSIASIPFLGFGTWNLKISDQNTTDAVAAAIETGYVHIDCAAAYGNQKDVGKGIEEGLHKARKKRQDIWVTSKLWNDHHAPEKVEEALNTTLKDLGLDYLDLYLMHWPVGNDPKSGHLDYDYVSTWHAMEKLLKLGTVRYIGVSNFSPHQLHELVKRSKVKPAVHQMELHPYLQQSKWVQFHQEHNIMVTAYSPLGNSNPTYHKDAHLSASTGTKHDDPPLLLQNHVMNAIAIKRGCSTAQVALAWGMARGAAVIPKSSHVDRIAENFGSQDCALSLVDKAAIDGIERTWMKRFNNPSRGWGVDLFEGLDGV